LTSIMTKTTGSALATSVGSRIYLDRAPDRTVYPYIVFMIVSDNQNNTFTDLMEDIILQFSIFSNSLSVTEIGTIYDNLKTLFDRCTLTITGNTFYSMERSNLITTIEDVTTIDGTVGLKAWHVEYFIRTKKP
jgi:hypothetical protein